MPDRAVADLQRQRLEGGGIEIGDHQPHALGMQPVDNGAAYTAQGAGDDGRLAFQALHDFSYRL